MKKIELDELKKIQLEILDYVANFCEHNNINYWLDCGTLIGTIRHKGYIPWDDDIDVGMLRPDYDKFMNMFNNNTTYYSAHCLENDKKWYLPYGKVLDNRTILFEPDEKAGIKSAVNIDIFVYDNAPEDDVLLNRMYKKRDIYSKFNMLQQSKHFTDDKKLKYNIVRIPVWVIFQLFPKSFFAKKVINNSKKFENTETGYVGNFTSDSRIKCSKEIFNSFIDGEFEGKKFKVPIGYDKWLTSFYGDYMKIPPKEKQISHHKFIAYYK